MDEDLSGFVHYGQMFVIYSTIQYSNQVLFCYYKDRYDFNTKKSIYSVKKCSCLGTISLLNYSHLAVHLQYSIPCIIMYTNNDGQRRVFVHCAFPVFIIVIVPVFLSVDRPQLQRTVILSGHPSQHISGCN